MECKARADESDSQRVALEDHVKTLKVSDVYDLGQTHGDKPA